MKFLLSGKPQVDSEVRTWVTRYEPTRTLSMTTTPKERKVRWSQLPIHAAIIFQAPAKLVQMLIDKYPRGVRSKDDQDKLPLHLAFRHMSTSRVIHMLMNAFPAGINAKDGKGREPLQCAPDDKAGEWRIASILEMYLKAKAVEIEDAIIDEEVEELQEDLTVENQRVRKLKKKNRELAATVNRNNEELLKLKTELLELNQIKIEERQRSAKKRGFRDLIRRGR